MLSTYLDVIKNRNFRFLWLAQIVSQIALNMLAFVLTIMVYQKTRSNIAVSLILLCFAVPSVVFGIVAGGIVDFYDKRTVLILCNFSRLVLMVCFFLFAHNIYAIFILTICISIITQFFIPAEAPSIASLVDKQNLLTANSLFTITFYLATVLGFILAGPALRLFGGRNVYLFMFFLMSAATLFVYVLPKIRPGKVTDKIHLSFNMFSDTIKDGINFINENVRIKQSLILLTFSQALITTLAGLAPGFSDRVLGIDLKDASYLIMGPAAIGLVSGAFLVGGFGNKILKGTIILIGVIAVSINLLLLSILTKAGRPSIAVFLYFLHRRVIISNLFMAMVLLFLLGIFNSFISVPANAILQSDSHTRMRGRVYGVLTSLTGGVSLLPVIFSGILADIAGVGKALSVLGIAVFVTGIYNYLQRRKVTNIIK